MKSICESLAKPSEANARALANLFPATKKQKFDPLSISVNSNSKNPAFSNKGRSKLITVVCNWHDTKGFHERKASEQWLHKRYSIFQVYEDIKGIIEQAFSLTSKINFSEVSIEQSVMYRRKTRIKWC